MRIDPLIQQYPIRIREVTLGVILGISLLFYLFPRFLGEAEKITTTFQEEIETFDIPQTEQIKIPEPPARPSVPIASEDEFFDEDITIEDTDLEDLKIGLLHHQKVVLKINSFPMIKLLDQKYPWEI